MNEITRDEAIYLAGQLTAGLLANPVNANAAQSDYNAVGMLQGVMHQIGVSFTIIEPTEDDEN